MIDKQWFVERIAARRGSMRGLARHMEVDPSQVSRVFSGVRRMQIADATAIAAYIGVTPAEVLAHAGLPGAVQTVPILWHIDGNGHATRVRASRVALLFHPTDPSVACAAGLVVASHGALMAFDDALVVMEAEASHRPTGLCLVAGHMVRVVGYRRNGTCDAQDMAGKRLSLKTGEKRKVLGIFF